jgi:beta-N-acetylhexosaminidase
MVGHTTVPGLSPEPASQSAEVVAGLLVDELGFDGLILSDALGMAAVGTSTQGDALVGFLRAGGDLGIVGPGGSVEGRRSVRAALDDGTLTEERLNDAAMAVLDTKGVDPCIVDVGPVARVSVEPGPVDPPDINPTEEP